MFILKNIVIIFIDIYNDFIYFEGKMYGVLEVFLVEWEMVKYIYELVVVVC